MQNIADLTATAGTGSNAASGEQSEADTQAQLMQGVAGTGKGLVTGNASVGADEGKLGMTSSASQKQALQERGQRIYGNDLSAQSRAAPLEAHQMYMQRLQMSGQVLQKMEAFNLENSRARIGALVDQNAAKMAIIGDIVGVVGAVAGGMIGGAGGAAVGASIGKNGVGKGARSSGPGKNGTSGNQQSSEPGFSDPTSSGVSSGSWTGE